MARDHGAAGRGPVPAPGGHDLQRPLRGAGAGRPFRHRQAAGAPVRGALRPRALGRRHRAQAPAPDRAGDRRRGEPRRGPHPAQLPRGDPGDAAHQLLPAGGRRRSQALPVVQARPDQAAAAAPAPPALRDLRLLAAHRGRPPARGPGGPRRDPLVGPARGLPHRGARADEGPDGEERGDRAGGSEGRLRGEAPAAEPGPRGAGRRGGGVLPHLHQRAARPDRQHRGRRDRAAAQRRALRRGRPVPRGRRRQGHRHLLRRRQRDRRRVRLLAGRRVRLRRLGGLRPQEDGHHRARRLGVGEAPLPRARVRTCRRRTSRSSGSATCRATCSATACCSRRTSA